MMQYLDLGRKSLDVLIYELMKRLIRNFYQGLIVTFSAYLNSLQSKDSLLEMEILDVKQCL